MTLDPAAVSNRPVRAVNLGPLATATQVRCAFRRLGQAVLDGKILPKVANSAMYAVAGAARCLELETAERISRQLQQLADSSTPRVALTHQPPVVVLEGEVLP